MRPGISYPEMRGRRISQIPQMEFVCSYEVTVTGTPYSGANLAKSGGGKLW